MDLNGQTYRITFPGSTTEVILTSQSFETLNSINDQRSRFEIHTEEGFAESIEVFGPHTVTKVE